MVNRCKLGERAYNPETGNHGQMTLNRVTSWATPNTRGTRLGCNQRQLAKEADAWQTPTGQDNIQVRGESKTIGTDRGTTLIYQAFLLLSIPSPTLGLTLYCCLNG
jgi:hypothetical protein